LLVLRPHLAVPEKAPDGHDTHNLPANQANALLSARTIAVLSVN
jgi:hypothetical protein